MTAGRVAPAVAAYFGMVAVAAAQLVALDDPVRTWSAAVPFVLAAAVVVVVTRYAADDRRGRVVLRAAAGAGVVMGVVTIGIFAAALPAGLGEPSGFYRTKLLVTTPVGDHNTVGGLLLVGVVATVLLAVEDRRWWTGVAATTVGVVATLSRGAALVLMAVGVGAFLVRARRPVAVGVLVAGTVATAGVAAAAVVLDASPPSGVEVPDGPIGSSIVGRVDLAVRGLELLAEHPFLGVGLGGYEEGAGGLPAPNHHAHNAVAHLGAEAGIVGAAIAVVVPGLLVWRGLSAAAGWRRELVLLGGAGLVAHAQVDILAGLVAYEVLLAVLVGLALSAGPAGASVAAGSRRGAVRLEPRSRTDPRTVRRDADS